MNFLRRYTVDPSWPKPLPNHWMVGAVVGVAVDSRDHVWITHRPSTLQPNETRSIWKAAPPVLEFDQDGTLVSSWGGPGAGYEWPQLEHGIYVDADDNVWLGAGGDKDAHILKFTRQGKFLMQIGHQGKGQRQQRHAESRRRRAHGRRPRRQRALRRRRLRQPPRHRLRRDDRRLQAPLGRLRQEAGRLVLHEGRRSAAGPVQRRGPAREQAEPVRSQRSSAAAVPHRPRRADLERRAGLRLRSHQRSPAGVQEGRHVRAGSVHREGDVRQRLGVGHRLLDRSRADVRDRHRRHQPAGLRAAPQDARGRRAPSAAPVTGPASSTARTTSRSTRRAISTSPKPTKESASRGSHGCDSAASPRPLHPGSGAHRRHHACAG